MLRSDPQPVTDIEEFNTRVPPFNNVLARQAVNYATDRNELVRRRGGTELTIPTCQLLPPNFPGYHYYCPFGVLDSVGHYVGPDMAKAQQLITESGTRGQHVTVDVNAFYARFIPRSEYFVGLLRQLGYKVTVRTIGQTPDGQPGPLDVYRNSANKVQIVYALGWQADFPLPYNFYNPRFSCSGFKPNTNLNPNVSEFCDPNIDNLAKRAHALDATDPAAADVLWQQVDQKLTYASPAIFTVTSKANALISPRLRNYTRTPIGFLIFDQMWVQ